MSAPRVLIVEDDEDIAESLRFSMEKAGFDVRVALDGVQALEWIDEWVPDLALLDIMVPRPDGFEICQYVKNRAHLQEMGIILVSAKGEEVDVVLGLGFGADDYITKPFSTRELIARSKAVLNRGKFHGLRPGKVYTVGYLTVDEASHQASWKGRPVELTATEFRMLLFFVRNPTKAFTRDEILNHAIGEDVYVIDRNVDVHILSLRKKLGCSSIIHTIRGHGYRFNESGCGTGEVSA